MDVMREHYTKSNTKDDINHPEERGSTNADKDCKVVGAGVSDK